ncbi:MAG: response regulator [Gemmatimonadetes bacterium]|nr:response regulator [Gemmatimonadota bacterium]
MPLGASPSPPRCSMEPSLPLNPAEDLTREGGPSDARLFEHAPVALVEFDLTAFREELGRSRELLGGIEEVARRPDEVTRLLPLIRPRRLNPAAVALYDAPSAEALRAYLEDTILPGSLPRVRDSFVAFSRGVSRFETHTVHRTMAGRSMEVRLSFDASVIGSDNDFILVSFADVTGSRMGAELLHEFAQQVAPATGEACFEAVVRFLGERFGADLAFVSALVPGTAVLRTMAAWRDGAVCSAFEYPLSGTPCHDVMFGELRSCDDHVAECFPRDPLLAEMGARGYVGTPLVASDGTCFGVMAAIFRAPIPAASSVDSALAVLASRASAEVERVRSDAQRRALEEQLVRAQRLESVGRLAGGISHDLNNLLAPILAYAEMALDRLPESDPLHADLKEILAAAERAAAVTRQLLAFSRRQVLEMGRVSLNSVVESLGRMLRTAIREEIHLVTRLSPDLADVHADRGQLEQVLLNLVVNARDAMPGGGRLTISTFNRMETGGDGLPPGYYACIEVVDTGCGMDEVTQAHIFEPFFTTKPTTEGTGLGLAVVYGIVQQHGGGIEVKSEPGKGTTMRVCLPAAAVSDPSPSTPPQDGKRLRGSEKIMVVEDETAVRRLVVAVLRRHGYEVVEAPTPLQGLELALDPSRELDLLVTDVVMPQMDGVELYRRISQQRPGLPVRYLSGYALDGIAARGVTEVNLLEKPFSLKDLTDRVRQALDG